MDTRSRRAAVWLTPLVVTVMSCSGGTQEARGGAPVSSSAEALPAAPSSSSATSGGPADVPSADSGSQGPVPGRSAETPPAVDPPTRPGAPYEIEAFDNEHGPYDAFLASIASRCPGGEGPDCLIIVASIIGDDTVPDQCTVGTFDYQPESGPAEAADDSRKLQRGTRVGVDVTCPETAVDPEDPPPPTPETETEPEPTAQTEPEPTAQTEPEPTAETQIEPETEPETEEQPEAPARTAP